MSYLLEALGRGLLADLRSAFDNQFPALAGDQREQLWARLEDSPDSFDLAMRLGTASLREMRLSDARQAFEKARQLRPDSAQPQLGLACVCDEFGQLEQCLEHLDRAHACDHVDPAILFGIAFCHERRGDTPAAQAAYRHTINLSPQLRNAYERIAAIAIRDDNWSDAIDQYERLAEMEPGDLDVLLTLGSLYLKADRPTAAMEQYQQALLIEPDGQDGDLTDVDNLANQGHLEEAILSLERLVRECPGMAPFHVRLGDLYVRIGEDERAIEEYNTALTTQPELLEATVKLGTQHMRKGRLVDAAVTFNRAVELNDRLVTAFVGLGVAQLDCGREDESLATFDLAASLEPSSTLLFSETARLQMRSENHRRLGALDDYDDGTPTSIDVPLSETLGRYERALAHSPNDAALHYRYGLLLRQAGKFDEATCAFRNAVTINPAYSKALVKLGICLKESGAVEDAIDMFQRALVLEHAHVDVHYQLGLMFTQRNQFDLAADDFQLATNVPGQDAAFQANLELALQSIGLVDKAAATWHSICQLSPTSDILTLREEILRKLQTG